MEMGAEEFFVDQFHARCFHLALHHLLGIVEIIVLVGVARAAVSIDQCRLTATSGTSCALGIVGRSGRHVAHADNGEILDVDAQLHGRGAIENGELALTELLLTHFTFFLCYLPSVVFCFQMNLFERYVLIELLEIGIWLTVEEFTAAESTEANHITADGTLVASLPLYVFIA